MGLIVVSYARSHCLDTTPKKSVVIVHVQEPGFLSAKHLSKCHSTASTSDSVQHQNVSWCMHVYPISGVECCVLGV